jgi:protein O-GlcNAcase/histone acetyltransferase
MAQGNSAHFLAGVIEGFYGKPWSQAERFELFDWMSRWGLNTYLYAPKDDLKQRVSWREQYSEAECRDFRDLLAATRRQNLRFVYALSPGLDIDYSRAEDCNQIKQRFQQMQQLGCVDFALLFDDIPVGAELQGSENSNPLALAQSRVANSVFSWLRENSVSVRLLFCPTAYCGRMARRDIAGANYLSTLGRELLAEIDILWTGPEIISAEITVTHLQDIQNVLRRKPLIWDNLHANDYDGRRFFCGPYAGRCTEIKDVSAGVLLNPNTEFCLNYIPLRTFARFLDSTESWDSRAAFRSALGEWLIRFTTVTNPIALEDFNLWADCYYLPQAEGPGAESVYQLARKLIQDPAQPPETLVEFRSLTARLREVCLRLTELRDRSLFYALSRRIWDLREELDLVEAYMISNSSASGGGPFASDAHLPCTYRGGFVARLQALLSQQPDGTFTPAPVAFSTITNQPTRNFAAL